MSGMRRWAWMGFLLVVASALGGCAAGSGTGGGAGQDRRELTAEEMEASGYTDAFSVVQALRPQWLWTRGTSTINQTESIKIYMDGNLLGGPDQLRGIPVRSIASIRFLDGLEATNRWGLDHGLGAIVVSTRREAP
ncbi:MAG: hypothetical protein MUO50_16685 [Longimicrobiales bacterium]|nr:hypothetical protein [Longimicrobiales bacterium]